MDFMLDFFFLFVFFNRISQSFSKTTWRRGWPTFTVCWHWIINFYKQMWVVFLFENFILFLKPFMLYWVITVFPGWGGGRSPGAPQVPDLRQRCSLRPKIRRGISAISSTLCHGYLEPVGFYWAGGQVRPGEGSAASSFCFCFDATSRCTDQHTSPWFQLVSNAIQFLASVCERPHYKHLFEDQNTLTSICEKVIVPNMEFRSKLKFGLSYTPLVYNAAVLCDQSD